MILLDSVLGLPREVFPKNKSLYDLMVRAHRFSQDGKKFGAKTADAFFAQFLENSRSPTPRRECEVKANAVSVFQRIPFQRNIGVGTFRSWSELGSTQQKWFSLWPIDDADKPGPWVFEAYPTHFWKTIIRSNKRDPSILKEVLSTQKHLKLHSSVFKSLTNPDMCDAIVLAYSGFVLHKRKKLFVQPRSTSPKKEGWILGI
ncbi:MAG: hypothetical protein J7501_16920 [Bdellovibrio sp.]|nr:hypothetical protein [Bdellovibrio sp.]